MTVAGFATLAGEVETGTDQRGTEPDRSIPPQIRNILGSPVASMDAWAAARSGEHDTIMHSDAADTSVGDDDIISGNGKLSGDSNESFAYGNSLFSSAVESLSSPRIQSTA